MGKPEVRERLVVLEEVLSVRILRVDNVGDAVRLERRLVRRRADVSDEEGPAVRKPEDGGYILVDATRTRLILESERRRGKAEGRGC